MILGEGKSLPMELEGETPWNYLGIVVGKIDPSSSKPEAHTTQILEKPNSQNL